MVYSDVVLADSPTGYWRMDETASDYVDSSGNSRTAVFTANAALTRGAAGALTTYPAGLSLQRTAASGGLVKATIPAPGTTFTLECWVNLAGTASAHAYAVFMGGPSSIGAGMVARRNSTNNRFSFWDNVGSWRESSATLALNGWNHLATVVEGTKVTFYQNGVLLGSVTIGSSPNGGYDALYIASTSAGGEGLIGRIDEVALYPTALSAARITAHYDAATTASNATPTADAGADQAVTVGQTVTLTGSGTDTDGTIASYNWTLPTRPGGSAAALSGTGATRTFTPDVAGTYVAALTVTDDDGATSTADTVTVTATAAPVFIGPHVRIAGAYVQQAEPLVRIGGTYV